MSDDQQKIKLCRTCGEVKPIENFYKRTHCSTPNRVCKACLKIKRTNIVSTYKKRPVGFAKLPIETQKNILYDLRIGLNYLEVSKKYNLCYRSMGNWKKQNKIKLSQE